MSPSTFQGLWLPLVTPLRDGFIDLHALRLLAGTYAEAGLDGFVLFGSTGEGSLISVQEKILGVQAVREAAPGLPLVIGAGGVDTLDVCAALRRMAPLRPEGWLVPPPYYLRPAPAGIAWHYRKVAQAAGGMPVIAYDVPARTGCRMSGETVGALLRDGDCAAIKMCDPAALSDCNVQRVAPLLCGDDACFLDHFLLGGAGAVTAAAHLRPDLFAAVMALARSGREAAARRLFDPMRAVIDLLFAEPNPAPLKHFLAGQGLIAHELRLPMTPAGDELGQRLVAAVARLPTPETVRMHRDIPLGAGSGPVDEPECVAGGHPQPLQGRGGRNQGRIGHED